MQFRHEYKYQISYADYYTLRSRLRTVMRQDAHAGTEGTYRIRSLYFDNLFDKALREKLDGVDNREKFRIRYYNNDVSFIRLEKKIKQHGLRRISRPYGLAAVPLLWYWRSVLYCSSAAENSKKRL